MNQHKAFNHLLIIKKIFDNLGIIFWLEGGTALGAYRQNSFMDSDFDVDIGMFGSGDKRFPEITEALKEEGFGFFHIKEHPCGEGKQISCVKDGIPLDIFVYYKRGEKRWRLMFDHHPTGAVRYIPCVLPSCFFNVFAKIDFMDYGVEFNLPYSTEGYLVKQYGNWRKDKTKDEFHWQTDYKCMDMSFEIYQKPKGKRRWVLVKTIKGETKDGSFFKPLIKEGYKLFPLVITKQRYIVDGEKRLRAYRDLGVPMVECYID